MRVVAVMPAFNEGLRIREAVLGVRDHIPEVLVVDDGSTDATVSQARVAGANVIVHAVNRGQGAALRTGTRAALHLGADVIVHVDADGQHDPGVIPALLAPITSGSHDVVFGSRFLGASPQGMPQTRRALLWASGVFSGYVLGIPRRVTDFQNGLRAMTSSVARTLPFVQDGKAHCTEILRYVTRSELRWMEIPTRVLYTEDTLAKGTTSMDAIRIVWELLLGVFERGPSSRHDI